MKTLYNKIFSGLFAGVLVFTGLASCTEDHFDVRGDGAGSVASLMDNIKSNKKLTKFKMILDSTKVRRTDMDKYATISYSKLLESAQTFTVWAPVDGSYNADSILELLKTPENNRLVEIEFLRNHIARFNFPGTTPDIYNVTMLNQKINRYNAVDKTFKNAKVEVGEPIVSNNGSLHLLDKPANYAVNIYEFLKEDARVDSIKTTLMKYDTVMFSASSSVPGVVVDGKIQYVDSVFITYNKLLNGLGLYSATNEDSLYVAVYPTNEAWSKYYASSLKKFNFLKKDVYYDQNDVLNIRDVNADSLRDIVTKSVMMSTMFYSLYEQPGFDPKSATVESVDDFVKNVADSLKSTSYLAKAYKQPYLKDVFEGKKPVELSNGFAYVVDSYNFIPSKSWMTPATVSASNSYNLEYHNLKLLSTAPSGTSYPLTAANRNDSVKGAEKLESFCIFDPISQLSNPLVSFKINPFSTTYDIYAVFVPENINSKNSKVTALPNRFSVKLITHYTEDGTAVYTTEKPVADVFETDPTKVDSILLYKDFKFPYSFTSGMASAVLEIEGKVTKVLEKRFNRPLYMNCIYMEPKDEE